MKARLTILPTLLFLLWLPVKPARANDPITSREIHAHIAFLADDLLEGRRAGERGAEIASHYIASQFEQLGLQPAGEDGSYFQRFPLRSRRSGRRSTQPEASDDSTQEAAPPPTTVNVLAWLPGGDPALQDEIVVLGAHFDHVGMRGDDIFNGADDNASGTSGVLEIAEALATRSKPLRRSVLIILFGAEEAGLVGSRYWVSNPTRPLEKVVAMVNLDMISRNDPGEVSILTTSDELKEFALGRAGSYGLKNGSEPAFYLMASDSGSFIGREIPTVFLFTGTHPDYHQPTDTVEKADTDKAERIARLAHDLVFYAAQNEQPPTFKAPDLGRRQRPRGKRLGISLADVRDGVVVGGVSQGTAAARAGVQKNDRIVRLGKVDVKDLRSLRQALQEVPYDTEVELVIERPGTGKVVLKATWPRPKKRDAD